MIRDTWFWCKIGITLFFIGAILRMYLVVRVKGWQGYLQRQTGVTASYRQLVADKKAALWPLPMSYIFIALGFIFIFGSILLIG
jgi:hypothetical protein